MGALVKGYVNSLTRIEEKVLNLEKIMQKHPPPTKLPPLAKRNTPTRSNKAVYLPPRANTSAASPKHILEENRELRSLSKKVDPLLR